MPKVDLNKFEIFHRSAAKIVYKKPSLKELFITFAVALLTAPFVSATFLMIPLIGQILILIAAPLTLFYFYLRRSLLVILAGLLGYALFWIPTLVVMQLIKDRLDVTLFFLMATGIPVTIFYILLVAGKIWFDIEHSQEREQEHLK